MMITRGASCHVRPPELASLVSLSNSPAQAAGDKKGKRMPKMIFSKSFAAGEEIFRMGNRGRNAYIIERGKVEVSVSRDGENMVVAELGKGEVFGEMSMIDDAPRSATITAIEFHSMLL